MFDLFRSRAKAVRILLGAMLGVVSLSMLVYLIPGTGITAADSAAIRWWRKSASPPSPSRSTAAASERVAEQQLPPDLASTYIPQMVDQAIAERAVAYEAQQTGLPDFRSRFGETLRSFPFGSLPPDQYPQYVEQNYGRSMSRISKTTFA